MSEPEAIAGYRLVWNEEFDRDGALDPADWSFEHGVVRNHEAQSYEEANAVCRDGCLVIEARHERAENKKYKAGSGDWHTNREYSDFTSASVTTQGRHEFLYGRIEVRARIPTASGSWPAIWTLGTDMEWPSCGEIDIMEFYRVNGVPHILANFCWGTEQRWNGRWKGFKRDFAEWLAKDPEWASKFHVWRMDWGENKIALSLDGEVLNEVDLETTFNGSLGNNANPFRQPHYLLLNLAIGGDNGGTPDIAAFPLRYEIDYVRVYEAIK